MKVNVSCLILVIFAAFVLAAPSARADLGLAGKPPKAVGAAVKNAVADAYKSGADAAAIQSQIVAILDEAAATGSEDAVRYAIVAVMLAGGTENLEMSKQAIGNSMAFTSYQELAAGTMGEAEKLMTGKEPGPPADKGPGTGKGEGPKSPLEEKPGKPADEMPPQTENIFDQFPPPSDGDIPATEI